MNIIGKQGARSFSLKYLVTGSVGRLGRELIMLLSESGHEVRALDLPFADWEIIREIKYIEQFPGDVTDLDVVCNALKDVDVVIHLAALLPPKSEMNSDLTMNVNVEGTRNIVEALELNDDVNLVFASSISTYGITFSETFPIRVDHSQSPHNLYAKSKIEAEQLVMASRVPYVILRVAPIAVARLLELPDVLPYRADQRIEFIDVEDTAWAFYQASLKSEARMKILNVAGGLSWQMTGSEFIDGFYGALGLEVEPTYSEEYTAVDWYDTSKSRFLGYQKTSFNDFQRKLASVAEELGLI